MLVKKVKRSPLNFHYSITQCKISPLKRYIAICSFKWVLILSPRYTMDLLQFGYPLVLILIRWFPNLSIHVSASILSLSPFGETCTTSLSTNHIQILYTKKNCKTMMFRANLDWLKLVQWIFKKFLWKFWTNLNPILPNIKRCFMWNLVKLQKQFLRRIQKNANFTPKQEYIWWTTKNNIELKVTKITTGYFVKIPPASPNSESLARRMTSSSESKVRMDMTDPNTSSFTTVMWSSQLTSIQGLTK